MILDRPESGKALLGSLQVADGKATVRMEDRFRTDIEDLWSALTDPRRLARWIGQVAGDLRPGGEFRANFVNGCERHGQVAACEPPRRLLITMSLGDDETVIEALLAADGDHTRLVVEERELPLHEGASHGAGWQVHFEDLTAYLAGTDSPDWHVRWIDLIPAYQERPGR